MRQGAALHSVSSVLESGVLLHPFVAANDDNNVHVINFVCIPHRAGKGWFLQTTTIPILKSEFLLGIVT